MDSTSSVSKGVFVFRNGFTLESQKRIKRKESNKNEIKTKTYASELWYESYVKNWEKLENDINKLNTNVFSNILTNLLNFVDQSYSNDVSEIPTATLLMGINMPDHSTQFTTLSNEIKSLTTPHVAILYADKCTSIKLLVENMVAQFIKDLQTQEDDEMFEQEDEVKKIRKSYCTFSLLKSWYDKKYGVTTSNENVRTVTRKHLVVILPEFESFQESVLHDFILIVSSYVKSLPFVIILGVATSLTAVHKSLPYQISSKLNIEVFSLQSASDYLNNVVNNVLLNNSCPFHLGGKTIQLFTDIFLFYDLSVKGFIQNFKFAMLEHYSYGNAMALCTDVKDLHTILSQFKHDDFENVRQLLSFRQFVESKDYKIRIKLLTDDKYLKSELHSSLTQIHQYNYSFHILLKCLYIFVSNLPGSPLGKQFRELYTIAVSENVTESDAYKECMKLLNFLSRDKLLTQILKVMEILKSSNKNNDEVLDSFSDKLTEFYTDLTTSPVKLNNTIQNTENILTENLNRAKLKQELLKLSKESKPRNEYELLREKHFNKLKTFFSKHLVVPTSKPFHEIYYFNNAASIKNHIIGSHRAAVHTALNNPQTYLQCKCCKTIYEQLILPSMPDLCIVYKLHLECGKFINMYDWLQAFAAIIIRNSNDSDEEEESEKKIDPTLQARFARAVAELEFLGFIKSSKRKTDHVQRLTWGGC